MMKLSIALLGFFILAPLPLWAAEEASDTHIFEFDYDHQIEAPVLNLPPSPAPAPVEAEETVVPLPEVIETAAPAPAPEAKPEEAPPSLESLFSPPEGEAPVPSEPAAGQAGETKAPEKAGINITLPQVGKPETETASKKGAQEKIEIAPSSAPAKKAAAPAAQAKVKSGGAPKATARPSEIPFIRDPRQRFWFLASRTWNNPSLGSAGGLPPIPAALVAPAGERPPLTQARAELIDLKEFPKLK